MCGNYAEYKFNYNYIFIIMDRYKHLQSNLNQDAGPKGIKIDRDATRDKVNR